MGIRQAGGWRIVLSFEIGRACGGGNLLSFEIRPGSRYGLGTRRGSRYGLGTHWGSRYVLGWPTSIGQWSILANWVSVGDYSRCNTPLALRWCVES